MQSARSTRHQTPGYLNKDRCMNSNDEKRPNTLDDNSFGNKDTFRPMHIELRGKKNTKPGDVSKNIGLEEFHEGSEHHCTKESVLYLLMCVVYQIDTVSPFLPVYMLQNHVSAEELLAYLVPLSLIAEFVGLVVFAPLLHSYSFTLSLIVPLLWRFLAYCLCLFSPSLVSFSFAQVIFGLSTGSTPTLKLIGVQLFDENDDESEVEFDNHFQVAIVIAALLTFGIDSMRSKISLTFLRNTIISGIITTSVALFLIIVQRLMRGADQKEGTNTKYTHNIFAWAADFWKNIDTKWPYGENGDDQPEGDNKIKKIISRFTYYSILSIALMGLGTLSQTYIYPLYSSLNQYSHLPKYLSLGTSCAACIAIFIYSYLAKKDRKQKSHAWHSIEIIAVLMCCITHFSLGWIKQEKIVLLSYLLYTFFSKTVQFRCWIKVIVHLDKACKNEFTQIHTSYRMIAAASALVVQVIISALMSGGKGYIGNGIRTPKVIFSMIGGCHFLLFLYCLTVKCTQGHFGEPAKTGDVIHT